MRKEEMSGREKRMEAFSECASRAQKGL